MTRKRVKVDEIREFKCPVCPYQAASPRHVAQHLAMKRDEAHRAWRAEHGLPEDYETMSDVFRMIKQIMRMLG